jgi:hypothetical protein
MGGESEKQVRTIGRRVSDEETPVRDRPVELTNIIISIFTVFMAAAMSWTAINTQATKDLLHKSLVENAKDKKDIYHNTKRIEFISQEVDAVKKDVKVVEKWITRHDARTK